MPRKSPNPTRPRPLPRCTRRAALCLVGLTFALTAAADQTEAYPTKQATVISHYLVNFVHYTEWPADAFDTPEAPVAICVLGLDPLGEVLDKLTEDKVIKGRRLTVARFDSVKEVRDCHLIYISRGERIRQRRFLEELRDLPVLTVGESKFFFKDGGGINLVVREALVSFAVNLEVTTQAELDISSHMLSLAREVIEPRKERN